MAGQPLVGRDAELAVLARAIDDAHAGTGRLVIVSGPAGIGKTRLAEAAVEYAQHLGLRVARGYAVDDPGAPPLWPWQRVLRGRLPRATAAVDTDAAARFQQFVALTDLLAAEAAAAGLLLVLEDQHWADAGSVQLLRHVTNELAGLPLAVLATSRSEAEPPWRDALPGLVHAGAELVELAGLAPADLAAWQPALAADQRRAQAVCTATGGNPLLVRLIAADLDAPLDALMAHRPELRRLVAARVLALDAATREVVEAASVLGERISAPVLAAMVGHDEVTEQLDLARRAGVLRGQAFEHALVRDAVYAGLDDARRVELHRAAALALETGAAGLPGVIAGHWQRAGDDRRCLHWARRADDAARAALAYADAARYAALAVKCAGRLDEDVAECLVRQAQVELLQGFAEASAHTCVRAAAAAGERADLVADAALVVHGSGLPSVYRLIAPLCEQALAIVAPDDHSRRSRLLAQLAITTAELAADPDHARALAAEALVEAERCDDADAQYEAIAARHHTIMVPETVGERAQLGARAVALADRSSRPIAALWGHVWRLDAAFQLGAMDEVEHELAQIDRIATDRRSVLARWHHLRHLAMLAALQGDFARARAANVEAGELADRVGDESMSGLSFAFAMQLATVREDLDELPAQWEQYLASAPPMPIVQVSRVILHATAGRLDDARAQFAEFRDLPRSYPRGVRWAATLLQVGVGAVRVGDAEVAREVYEQLSRFGDEYQGDGSGGVFTYGAWALPLGDLARVAGDDERAIAHYRTAITLDMRIGARPSTASSRLGLAEALASSRAPAAEIRAAAEAAAAEFEQLDMPGPLRRARALLSRARDASPLTPRENEIADLVARSLSNRDIAAQLVLSERTVETHVRSILAKLGFSSRTEIVAWVLRSE